MSPPVVSSCGCWSLCGDGLVFLLVEGNKRSACKTPCEAPTGNPNFVLFMPCVIMQLLFKQLSLFGLFIVFMSEVQQSRLMSLCPTADLTGFV